MENRVKENLFILGIAALLILIYINTLKVPFILDDSHMIVENTFIKHPKYFQWFFQGFVTSFPIPKGMCRPILMLTFAFNYATSGLNPAGYHIINILFHFLNVVMFYFLVKFFKKDIPFLLLGAVTLLFAIHPLNTEAIVYISSRSDLMVTFFGLCAFLFYQKNKNTLACLSYILALLTKETGLCIILFIIAYDIIYRINDVESAKNLFKQKKYIYLGLLLITGLYIFYRTAFFLPETPRILRSYYSNILVQSIVTALYLKLFLFPCPLNIFHYIPPVDSIFQPLTITGALVIILLFFFILFYRKKQRLISFGISWFIIGLLPKFYARLSFVAMEHHFYLAGIGLYLILAGLTVSLCRNHKKYFLYGAAGIISLMAILTILRNCEYMNPLVFWKISWQRNPYSGTISNNLGTEYLRLGLITEAKNAFEQAVAISDRKESIVLAKINLANIYRTDKKYEEAIKLLQETLQITDYAPFGIYQTLGAVYMETGDEQKALQSWYKDIELYPGATETLINLGIFYFKKEEFDRAKQFFQRATEVGPEHYAGYYGLAQIYEKENKSKEAILLYQKTISLKSDDAASHYFLGMLYANSGDAKALNELKTAVELNPKFAEAHNDLAVIYASLNPPDWKMAKKHLNNARALGYPVDENLLQIVEKHLQND